MSGRFCFRRSIRSILSSSVTSMALEALVACERGHRPSSVKYPVAVVSGSLGKLPINFPRSSIAAA